MKIIRKVLLLIIAVILFAPIKAGATSNTVNMYLFYRADCPHCAALEEALVDIQKDYPNLKVYKYEILYNAENRELMSEAASILNTDASYVPFTIIGTKNFVGYSETQTKADIEYALKLYSSVSSYKDPVGEMLKVDYSKGNLTYDDVKKDYENKDSTIEDNNNYVIDVPLIGAVSTKNLSLPIISIIIGLVDGFNPCAMWVLLFLISVLIGMNNRKRMWILGLTFLVTSALIYLAFMLAWLNITVYLGAIWWVKLLIALVALIGGYINLRAYLKTRKKDSGCEIVDEAKRKKMFTKIKKFTGEKSFWLAFLGIITLAVSVNFVELACSAGLPVLFTSILALNHLSALEYGFYFFLYILFFLLDDLIVFFVAMISLKLTGISSKYGKLSHLIGGIVMIIIGILMIFKPEWLMFNF